MTTSGVAELDFDGPARLSVESTSDAHAWGHVWGPLQRSLIAGTVHRKCQVEGCNFINAYDDEEEFCSRCGKQFFSTDDGDSHHSSATTGIDHAADADHFAFYDGWDDD